MNQKIIYTETDEAPALATYSLLPIVKMFTSAAGIEVEKSDISLASRILAMFPEYLESFQLVENSLTELGELVKSPEANIIKLPNISASLPQLLTAIKELKEKGFNLPEYPEHAESELEKEVKNRYDKIKGSAVNPVLREGNSDRRAPSAVKEFARSNPHSMGDWSVNSKSHVSTMTKGDFYANEKSVTLKEATTVRIELKKSNGEIQVLKPYFPILKGEIIDGTFLSKRELISFLKEQKAEAKKQGVLFSLHMKATMMKVSDPIIFGHAVKVYFSEVFENYSDLLNSVGANPNDGLQSMLSSIHKLPLEDQNSINEQIKSSFESGPDVAMVNSEKGISNLHVPSDVIIDASMPAMIRTSGKMWNKNGELQDTKAIIPDSSYAGVYSETINFCKANGAFDPKTMGTVPNVGLMAQKAEEYGSHDKTFELASDGVLRVVSQDDVVLMEHNLEVGDIWRMCQAKDEPIKTWVKLAVDRAEATGWPTVFWLDSERAHDAEVIKKVNTYLKEFLVKDLNISIKSPIEATKYTLRRLKDGENTISVTGNVLRDYLTDLFPILELGTSAKMLSIVPLMNGGGLFETGAGGSAPKHVEQLVNENHLRWDSLGEFLALAVSLEHLGMKTNNSKALILAEKLDKATKQLLLNGNSPSRKVGELDNRGSHYYLALYWARALSEQIKDSELQEHFQPIANELEDKKSAILEELEDVQGRSVELGGYYYPDKKKVESIMRPSKTLNSIIG